MFRRYTLAAIALAVFFLLPSETTATPLTISGRTSLSQTQLGTSHLLASPSFFEFTYPQPSSVPVSLIIGEIELFYSPGAVYNSLFNMGITFTQPGSLVLPTGTLQFTGVGTYEGGVMLSVTQPGPMTILLGGDIYEISFSFDHPYIVNTQGTYVHMTLRNTTSTPEPATLFLLGTGLAGIATGVYRRRKASTATTLD